MSAQWTPRATHLLPLGLILLLVAIAWWTWWRVSEQEANFRKEIMAIANARWEEGETHIEISEVIMDRLKSESSVLDDGHILAQFGLTESPVTEFDYKLLEQYDANRYRVFNAILDRTGVLSY